MSYKERLDHKCPYNVSYMSYNVSTCHTRKDLTIHVHSQCGSTRECSKVAGGVPHMLYKKRHENKLHRH